MLHSSRLIAAAAGLLGLALSSTASFADPVKFDFWYGLSGDLSNVVQQICSNFNKSQSDYQVVCTSQTDYDTNLQNTIAAYRANKQPTITQIYDIGTLTMLLSQAYYPVDKLMADNGYKIDWSNYFPGIAAYYATSKGEMNSLPFNSSTAVLYWNKDAFAKIGKTTAPATIEEMADDMAALKKAGYDCPLGVDISNNEIWQLMEQFSAIHDAPVATLNDGYDGLGARVVFNKGLFPKYVSDLKKWYDEGLFKLKSKQAGEDYVTAFADGHCQMTLDSIGDHGTIGKTAAPTMHWGTAMLPVYAGTDRKNSLVGGASLWVLKGKSGGEYKGAAAFLNWLSQPQQALFWSTQTGYIPVTKTGYDFMMKSGFYDKPLYKGREVAIQSLTASAPTPLTRGMRLGTMPQIRQEVANALQAIFANQMTVQQGLDQAADRSNADLAKFEQTYHDEPLP
jgi:sn-glycerol 3-phosphate transport system substrate-binding protein